MELTPIKEIVRVDRVEDFSNNPLQPEACCRCGPPSPRSIEAAPVRNLPAGVARLHYSIWYPDRKNIARDAEEKTMVVLTVGLSVLIFAIASVFVVYY